MNRLTIERRSARVWFGLPDGRMTSLMFGDAECLVDLAARMENAQATSDVRVGTVGLRYDLTTAEISLHGEDWSSSCSISAFDIGTLARMLKQATTARVFSGSIGIVHPEERNEK